MMFARCRRVAGLSAVVALTALAPAHGAQAPSSPPSYPALAGSGQPVALARTHEFTMRSRAGRDYRLFVAVPPGEPPAQGYGVMTVLDANAYFGVAAQAMGLIQQFPRIPEKGALVDAYPTLVVGVAYPGDEPIQGERRTWDFVPAARNPASLERLRGPQPGGADAFSDFLVRELRPALAAQYAIHPERQTLVGHSLGGYFVLHQLARDPAAFQRYVSISPAVWWDDSRILQDLATLAPGRALLLLAMAQQEWPGFADGSAEMLNGARALHDVLRKQGLAGDALRYVEVPLEDHMTTPFSVMPSAARFATLP
ncbi:alpha/beta hydrolase [Achromobacter sp. GG226]|uniref:alpha/beta hydrolase n=1 Tax=Verticiella alkaliphila TaxID=2779529 RepID=UPI001C0BF1B2|nr:alpha/beta hydrolase-fold protein [Verticiella sp. GG226]MBU4609112.1 alpha/beta hydrolase [Verticiella sp. GG226]